MSIAYFAHELADPAVQKRVKMLRAGGRHVSLLGFERARFAGGQVMIPQPHVLGLTENGKLLSRAWSVLQAIPRAYELRRFWMRADALMARNLEMLLIVRVLAAILRLETRIIYECLDIHPLMDGATITAPNIAGWTPEDGWVIENEGVPPDIEVEETPATLLAGRDPQLEKAIEVAMQALAANPPQRSTRPPYPIRVPAER